MENLADSSELLGNGGSHRSVELLSFLYDDLCRLAARLLSRKAPNALVERTSLVHYVRLRVCWHAAWRWDHERHLFAVISTAMRRILVENARRRNRRPKRALFDETEGEQNGGKPRTPNEQWQALREGLGDLRSPDPRAAELVYLRFFVGLTQAQAVVQWGILKKILQAYRM